MATSLVLTLRHKSTVFTRERMSRLQNSGIIDLADFTSLVFLICESHQFRDMYDLLKDLNTSDFASQLDFFEVFSQFLDWEHKFVEALERLNNKKALLSFSMVQSDSRARDHKYCLNAPRVILYRILEELCEKNSRRVIEHLKNIGAPMPSEDLPFLELYFMFWHVNGFLDVDSREGFVHLASALRDIGKPELAFTLGWHPELQYNRFVFDDDFPIEMYPIQNLENPGLCLIINQVRYGGKGSDRESSLVDVDKLTKLMTSFNFTVIALEDVSSKFFCSTIREIVLQKFSEEHSVFMLIIMAHGSLGLILCPLQNETGVRSNRDMLNSPELETLHTGVSVEEIRACIFQCDVLRGKPKIFIVNACRGNCMFTAMPESQGDLEADEARMQKLPKSDIITCYSALPDFISFRDKYKGALFINVFCDVLSKRPDIEVCELFTLVNARLMQPTSELSLGFEKGNPGDTYKLANPLEFVSSLTKKLYLKVPDFGNKT